MRRLGAVYIRFVVVCGIAFGVTSCVAAVCYYRDAARLSTLSRELTANDETQDEKIDTVANFVTNVPGKLGDDSYFLLPVFAPLKPTACQVIDGGGDCAFRARAFIVLMRTLDIQATKLCLHDPEGVPRHAVARVDTDEGPLIVDVLFGIVYRHDDGTPMNVDHIARHHASIISEQVRRGNERAAKYPLERYPFDHVTTINWEKGAVWRSMRVMLGVLMSEESIDNLSRPYIAEEPALMIIAASSVTMVALLVPILAIYIVQRTRPGFHKRSGVMRSRRAASG